MAGLWDSGYRTLTLHSQASCYLHDTINTYWKKDCHKLSLSTWITVSIFWECEELYVLVKFLLLYFIFLHLFLKLLPFMANKDVYIYRVHAGVQHRWWWRPLDWWCRGSRWCQASQAGNICALLDRLRPVTTLNYVTMATASTVFAM